MMLTVGAGQHLYRANPAHVHEVADRLVVLDRGRVLSEISPKAMTAPELTELSKKMAQRSGASILELFEALRA